MDTSGCCCSGVVTKLLADEQQTSSSDIRHALHTAMLPQRSPRRSGARNEMRKKKSM
jgi:hypothetical protein